MDNAPARLTGTVSAAAAFTVMPTLRTLVAFGLIVSSGPGVTAPPRVPAGQWAIEYQDETCTLSRDGLEGELGIAIRTGPLDERHELMLYGPFKGEKGRHFQGRLSIEPDGVAADRPFVLARRPGRKPTTLQTDISPAELAGLDRAKFVRITGPGGFEARGALPPMGRALAALRECEVYLAGRWGITRGEMERWVRPARPVVDLRRLFWSESASNYGMLRSGFVRGVLDITADGRMVGCRIVHSSKIAWVDAQLCSTLREKARFEPARNAAGEAVPGKVVTPEIRWFRLR